MSKKTSANSATVTKKTETTVPSLNSKKLRDSYPDNKHIVHLNHRIEFIYTSFIKEYLAEYKFSGERHRFWEMVYVMDGNVTITEDEIIYNMKKGDVIFHMPNEFHSISIPPNASCKLMIITFLINSNLINELGNGIYKLNDELHDILMKCYNSISDGFMVDYTYIRKKELDYNEIAEAMAIINLEKFTLEVLSRAKKHTRLDSSTSAENYKRIIEVLSEHIKEKLTIEDIANYCYMSTFNVKKTFSKYSGCGILQYFNALKIIRAKELIKQGYTADFISTYLGYSSPSYFSRAFKKETGMSPQKYKNTLL